MGAGCEWHLLRGTLHSNPQPRDHAAAHPLPYFNSSAARHGGCDYVHPDRRSAARLLDQDAGGLRYGIRGSLSASLRKCAKRGMKNIFIAFVVLTIALLAYSTYQGLFVAPTEQTMGEVQRIFYYHVPSAWTAGVCFFVNFLASLFYLWKRNLASDALAAASAEVGVMFCTVVLITGPIWARPVWGIWWTWDARLTTTLVLWLIYVSYLVLRRFAAGGQTQVLAAALAIFGFVDVPIVYMSIRWFRTQHPSPVLGGGENSGLDPAMLHAFFWNLLAFTCVGIVLMVLRYRLQVLEEKVEATHAAAALQGGAR